MNIYNLNNISLLVYAFLLFYKGTTNKKKIIFISIAFIQLFLIAAFRSGVGNDYGLYSTGFFTLGRSPFNDLTHYDWEWGFNLYTKIIYYIFPNNVQMYFAITAAIILIPVALFIYKKSNIVWLSTLCYINLYFFYMSLNFLRQAIAASIILFAWRYVEKRCFVKFLIVVLVAMSFHYTAFIFIPIYILVKMSGTLKTLVIYCFLLLFVYISSSGILDIVTEFYHPEYRDSRFLTLGIHMRYNIVNIVILIMTAIYSKKLITFNKNNSKYINLMYFSGFWLMTMLRHSILERFSYYTYIIAVIVLIPNIYIIMKKDIISLSSKIKSLNTINVKVREFSCKSVAILCFITILFLSNYIGLTAPQFMEGSNYGVHGVLPYKNWLQKI